MRQIRKRLAVAGLLACAFFPAAGKAFGPTWGSDPYYRSWTGREGGAEDAARRDRAFFDRVRMDLDRASAYPYSSGADRKRFDEARRELFDFESRFDQGLYDRHQLDRAIDRLDRVASRNSLSPRDRGALDEDLRRLRDYRNVAREWR